MIDNGVSNVQKTDMGCTVGQTNCTIKILSSSSFDCAAHQRQSERRNSSQKSPSTIWREQSASLSR